MNKEIWKAIPGYEDLYEASNRGRIRTKPNKVTYRVINGITQKRVWKSRVLKEKNPNSRTGRGDKRFDLWKDGEPKTFLGHRLVALTFIPNPGNKPCINHIDGNFRNNKVENLEWVTYSENMNHSFKAGLHKTNIKITLKHIEKGNSQSFVSMSKASQFLGRNAGYISSLLIKGQYEADGYSIRVVE